ncbi:hypothetical protein Ddc_10320 [Ditylenchus destructor]|nr:hypothetical protein Ddc_10320 [Ditylenchus destructor]
MSALEGVNQSQNQTSNPSSAATPSKRKQAKPQRIEDKVDEKSDSVTKFNEKWLSLPETKPSQLPLNCQKTRQYGEM